MINDLSQAKKLVEESQDILIAPARQSSGDSLGSCLALLFTLRKMGKNANLLTGKIPTAFQFLADLEPSGSRDFVISIDGSEKEIGEMRYEKNEQGLKIYLTLDKGRISKEDISFPAFNQKPNLIIALGAVSLADLDFYQTPIINIDNQQANENFGLVNLVDTACSLTEISTGLIEALEPELIDQNVATCLLTGLVSYSQNFRHPKTQPKTFEAAARLIKKGADHQKIVQHLYRQKSIAQIRILGKVLEKLKLNKEKELYYVALTKQDFQECAAQAKDLSFVVEELKFNFRYLPNLLILWQSHASPAVIRGILYSIRPNSLKAVLENYRAVSQGEGALFVAEDDDLISVQEKILQIL